jgi:hypothetical protein
MKAAKFQPHSKVEFIFHFDVLGCLVTSHLELLLQLRNLYRAGRIPWIWYHPASRLLLTQGIEIRKQMQTPILRIGFELTIPVFDGQYTFHFFYLSATVVNFPYRIMSAILQNSITEFYVVQ